MISRACVPTRSCIAIKIDAYDDGRSVAARACPNSPKRYAASFTNMSCDAPSLSLASDSRAAGSCSSGAFVTICTTLCQCASDT
eukprot:31372-Pelagococcus_subviridis.AAC.2